MPKYQLSIVAIILGILVPLAVANAAYNDVTLTTDTVITVGGYTLTVSGSSASLESIEVNPLDFSVNVPSGSTVTIASASRQSFTVDGVPTNYVTKTCTDSASTLVVAAPSGGGDGSPTASIIPSATTCTTPSTAGSSVSSGGSGGGAPGPVAPVVPPVTLAVVPGCPTGVVCTPKAVGASASVVLTSDLSRGSSGADVEKLQKFLAQDKMIYPEGIINGTFGPATERAVKKFQAKYGLSQVGRVGPATRKKIEVLSASDSTLNAVPPVPAVVPASAPATTPATSVVFTKLLSKGISGDDVKNLQKILNKDPDTQIASDGTGSPGHEGTLYGSLTEQAVQKFQVKYKISGPGQEGYGTVGPKTRAKLNELSK